MRRTALLVCSRVEVCRVNTSAKYFHPQPLVTLDTWLGVVADGLNGFERNTELYIRPMYWAETGAPGGIRHDLESTRWCLCIYEAPLPKPLGTAITLSPFRRPTAECAPVDIKAACLYPNNSRALAEAASGRPLNSEFMVSAPRSAVIWMARFQYRTAAWRSSSSGPDHRYSGSTEAMRTASATSTEWRSTGENRHRGRTTPATSASVARTSRAPKPTSGKSGRSCVVGNPTINSAINPATVSIPLASNAIA